MKINPPAAPLTQLSPSLSWFGSAAGVTAHVGAFLHAKWDWPGPNLVRNKAGDPEWIEWHHPSLLPRADHIAGCSSDFSGGKLSPTPQKRLHCACNPQFSRYTHTQPNHLKSYREKVTELWAGLLSCFFILKTYKYTWGTIILHCGPEESPCDRAFANSQLFCSNTLRC